MTALIEAKDLVRILPETVPVMLVDGISMTVREKEFIAITGPSGSGKSSLLYLLGLLDRPTSGTLLIGGRDTAPMNEIERAETRLAMLGFVFQFHFLLAGIHRARECRDPDAQAGAAVARGDARTGKLALGLARA